MTAEPHRYWAITGRIPYDDEDTPFATPQPCTREEAVEGFKQWMVDTALSEGDDEEALRSRMELLTDQDLTDGIYVISSFCSDSPILHG